MKIAIIGDTHFGYAWNSERQEDSFIHAERAIDLALEKNVDLILQTGDMFDSRVPKPEVIANSMNTFSKTLMADQSNVKILDGTKSLNRHVDRVLNGVPLIAIYGTHDRRSKGLVNPVQFLEKAGFLVCLDRDHIVIEKNGEKVAIHGMSGVPERYAGDKLKNWSPKPIDDAKNMLLLHQSIDPFIYSPQEPPTISIPDLPKGFDLIANGHIHSSEIHKTQDGATLLLTGSIIITQINEDEIKNSKKIYIWNTETDEINSYNLDPVRETYYEIIDVTEKDTMTIKEEIEKFLKTVRPDTENKPIVKVKLVGKLPKGSSIDTKSISERYGLIMNLRFDKRLEEEETKEQIKLLRNIRNQSLSAEEIGLKILEEKIGTVDLDHNNLFNLLAEDQLDKVLEFLEDYETPETNENSISEDLAEKKIPVVQNDEWKRWLKSDNP